MHPLHFSEDHARLAPVEELDRVRLTRRADTDSGSLDAGSEGTVVAVYGENDAFCVEFTTPLQALVTVGRDGIEVISEGTIARLASASKSLRR